MDKEELFSKKLQEIRYLAQTQGDAVNDAELLKILAEFDLDDDKLKMVYDYLESYNIKIGEPVEDTSLTGEEKEYLKEYLDELSSLTLIDAKEYDAIVLQAMAGEVQAQERLIHHYLPIVTDVAKLYAGQGIPYEDLIGEGNLTLALSVKMLGAFENVEEATNALGISIMNAMEDYIQNNAGEGKKDRNIADKVNKVADAARELSEAYGRKVTPEELVQEGSLSLKTIREAIRFSGGRIEDLENQL